MISGSVEILFMRVTNFLYFQFEKKNNFLFRLKCYRPIILMLIHLHNPTNSYKYESHPENQTEHNNMTVTHML